MRKMKHNQAAQWLLKFFVLAMILAMLCPAGVLAQDGLTVEVQTVGSQVTIQGITSADSLVTLKVTKSLSGDIAYIDQFRSDAQGGYQAVFQLADGDYRVKVNGGGKQEEKTFKVDSQVSLLAPPVLDADTTDNTLGKALDLTFTDDPVWRSAISSLTVDGSELQATQYTVTEGNLHLLATAITTAGSHSIAVKATGYNDATVNQSLDQGNQDQERADEVSALITALPNVEQITLADKTAIEAARTAYNALSAAQKALVTNLTELTAAEARLAELQTGDTTPPVITVKDTADQTISEDLTVPEPSFSFKVVVQDEKDGVLNPSVQLNGAALQAGSNGTYTCTLTPGSNTLIITAMDAAGNRAEKSLTINLANLAYQKAVLDSGKKTVTLTFNMAIFNNKASLEELKDAVNYAVDGTSYTTLNAADQVSIVGKTLVVSFNSALTGNSSKLKLAANSLKDAAGNALSSEITTEALDAGELDECFIATAAFGSKYQPDVVLLRQFRDHCLLSNPLGQAFVKFYYKHSPPIANFIAHSEGLKVTVRGMLIPLVVIAYMFLHPGVMIGLLAIGSMTIAELRRKKKNRVKALSLTGK